MNRQPRNEEMNVSNDWTGEGPVPDGEMPEDGMRKTDPPSVVPAISAEQPEMNG